MIRHQRYDKHGVIPQNGTVEDAVPYRCDIIVFTGIELCCYRGFVSSTGERCSPLQIVRGSLLCRKIAMLIPHSGPLFHCILYLHPQGSLFRHIILRFCAILLLFLLVLPPKYPPYLLSYLFFTLISPQDKNLQNHSM